MDGPGPQWSRHTRRTAASNRRSLSIVSNYTLSALIPTAVGNATSDWTVRADATWLSIGLTMLKLTTWILTALLLAAAPHSCEKAEFRCVSVVLRDGGIPPDRLYAMHAAGHAE
jgi:hypothetical protein